MSKVIVVDDVKSYCDTVCDELKAMGISAVGCQTVKKAKWLIERARRTDVLLVDLMLNDESGENGTDIPGQTLNSYYKLYIVNIIDIL